MVRLRGEGGGGGSGFICHVAPVEEETQGSQETIRLDQSKISWRGVVAPGLPRGDNIRGASSPSVAATLGSHLTPRTSRAERERAREKKERSV